jgi:hypothetical protein
VNFPVFDQVHAFFISTRERVLIIALQLRTHRQEIFNRDFAFAWVWILKRLLIAEVISDVRIDAGKQVPVEGQTD